MKQGERLRQDIDGGQGEGTVTTSRISGLLRLGRKVGVALAGGALLVLGLTLIVLPGPAIVVIPLGLALLATEFSWAARLLRYLKERAARVVERGRRALPARP